MSGEQRVTVRIRCDTCRQSATPWLPPEQAVALIVDEGWRTVGDPVFGAHLCADCVAVREARATQKQAARARQ